MYAFYGNYYVYLCVYIVMGDYLCVFMRIYLYLCVYIVMGNYLCLSLVNVGIYFYCILKVCKKTNNQLNIYPHNNLHNNLRYI